MRRRDGRSRLAEAGGGSRADSFFDGRLLSATARRVGRFDGEFTGGAMLVGVTGHGRRSRVLDRSSEV